MGAKVGVERGTGRADSCQPSRQASGLRRLLMVAFLRQGVLLAILVRAAFAIAEAPQHTSPPVGYHGHRTTNTQVSDEHLGGIKAPALRDELLEMEALDQAPRRAGDLKGMAQADQRNLPRLKEIIAKHGWPRISMVGERAAGAAFLIAQHAVHDRPFQLQVLALMEALVEQGEVRPREYAYLYDRTHEPQRYGTQGSCTGPGVWKPREIEDAAHVDARRAAVGMIPATLAEYAAEVGKHLCRHAQASPATSKQ